MNTPTPKPGTQLNGRPQRLVRLRDLIGTDLTQPPSPPPPDPPLVPPAQPVFETGRGGRS